MGKKKNKTPQKAGQSLMMKMKQASSKQPSQKKRRQRRKGGGNINPGFVGQTSTFASAAPVKLGFSYGNNVPKFERVPPLGALPGMKLITHSVSSPVSVVAASGVQDPAYQVGSALINASTLWANSSFGTFPTNALLGSAAATIAGVFDYCYLRRVRVRFLPDAEAGSQTKGNICLAWQPDPNQSLPTSLPEMSNNAVAATSPVWQPCEILIDAGEAPRNLREAYQMGTSSTSASGDYHMGRVLVGAEGIGISGNTSATTYLCGRLEVDAEVMVWGITA